MEEPYMRSVIIVSSVFDKTWPYAADHFHSLWSTQGEVEFIRLVDEDSRPTGAYLPQDMEKAI
jgi:hypothetical protein